MACTNRTEPSAATGMSAPRKASENDAVSQARSVTSSLDPSGPDEPFEAVLSHQVNVLAVLQHRSKCRLGNLGTERIDSEKVQGRDPVDHLRNAWLLLHVEAAEPSDRSGCLIDKRRRRARDSATQNLSCALGRWVIDPVVQAAPLERVVQV